MKGRQGGVILFVFVLTRLTTARVPAALDASDLLGYLKRDSNTPLIVIVNSQKTSQKSHDFDDLFITGDDGVHLEDDYVYEKEAKEQAKYLLYNYLNAPTDSQETSSEDPKSALREALRNRCQAVVECESKCKPKKNKYCPMNCKAVFDKLDLCEAPKPKYDPCKKKSDDCNSWGKTMPPRWLKK